MSYISPTTMTANSASNPDATQMLNIYGSNFTSGNVVQFYWTQGSNAYLWNNSKSTPTITSTLITLPMDPGPVADTISVRVCESASQLTASTCSSGTQSVTVTVSAPTVSSVSPSPVPGSNSNQTLTITGSRFVSGATVTYYDPSNTPYSAHAASVSNSNTIVDTAFDDNSDAGTWHVVVTNSGGSPSNSYPFTVSASVVTASISGVSPSPVPGSNSNQTLTITGSGFVSGATVTYYDPSNTPYSAHAASVSNSNTIVDTEFDDGNDAGTWHVVVTNPGGQPSNSYPFTVN